MCGRAGAPQFGQFTVAAAVAFQFARRECVLAREVLYLGSAIVFPPLCKPDCKGLCPQCGKNLNEGKCGCSARQVDPRLEILKKLID